MSDILQNCFVMQTYPPEIGLVFTIENVLNVQQIMWDIFAWNNIMYEEILYNEICVLIQDDIRCSLFTVVILFIRD